MADFCSPGRHQGGSLDGCAAGRCDGGWGSDRQRVGHLSAWRRGDMGPSFEGQQNRIFKVSDFVRVTGNSKSVILIEKFLIAVSIHRPTRGTRCGRC